MTKRDQYGRDSIVTDGGGHETRFYYSTSGMRNLDSVKAAGRKTTFRHDAFGRRVVTVGPDGIRDSVTYDALNRVSATINAMNQVTTFGYIPGSGANLLDLATVTDPLGNTTTLVRNQLGAVTNETRSGSSYAISTTHEITGKVVSVTNRRGQTVSMQYDALGRLTQRSGPDISTATFGYQFATPSTNGFSAASNSESTDTLFYDAAGRLMRSLTYRGSNWYQLRYVYTNRGLVDSSIATSNRWTGGRVQRYTYNTTDALASLQFWAGTAGFGTNNEDQPTSGVFPNGLEVERGYSSMHYDLNTTFNHWSVEMHFGHRDATDLRGRLSRVGYPTADLIRKFAYDSAGRLKRWERWTSSEVNCPPPDPNMGYDCTISDSSMVDSATYTYDAGGNRTNGGASISSGNRVSSAFGYTFTYDEDGNLASKSASGFSQTLSFNAAGEMDTVVTNSVTTTFGYDAFGRRVRKTHNGTTTRYVHENGNVLFQLDGSGDIALEYAYLGLDQPLAMRKGDSTFYFMQDPAGNSAVGLIRADNTNAAYVLVSPWGQIVSESDPVGMHMRFAGREYDAETGFYLHRARYYDPMIGRFISQDPIGVQGGVNLYAYANNDPVNSADPSGMISRRRFVWKNPWRDIVRWAPVVATAVIGFGAPTWLAAFETMGATAAGSALTAGVESWLTGADFGDAFTRNFGYASLNFVFTAARGGGVVSAGSRNLIHGYVNTRKDFGALTIGASTVFDKDLVDAAMVNGVTNYQHEVGHLVQFVGLSAFRWAGGAGPWAPYLGMGLMGLGGQFGVPGTRSIGCAWEATASWLGGGAFNAPPNCP